MNKKTTERTIPRMRTIRETAKETGVSEYLIRRLVKENKIFYIKSGTKVLLNLDKFIAYLQGE